MGINDFSVLRGVLPGLSVVALSLILQACVSPAQRTGPPAPVYEQGQRVDGWNAEAAVAGDGVQTQGIAGPSVQVGQGPTTAQSGLPRPEAETQVPYPSNGQSSDSPRVDGQTQLAVYTPPAEAPSAAMPMNAAARSLAEQSDAKYQRGDLTGAVALLERAMRVEPAHPYLWNRLARVRLSQGKHLQAVELAQRANALTGADNKLKRDNWLLISQAKKALGDYPGAREAERRAQQLR
jgi:hypothetical protein